MVPAVPGGPGTSLSPGSAPSPGPVPGTGRESYEGRSAETVTLVLAGALRSGTLVLALAQAGRAAWLVAALAVQSLIVFGRCYRRVQLGRLPAIDAPTAVTETVCGALCLVLAASVLGASSLSTSAFWAEPYTVITVVIVGAAGWRLFPGLACAGALTVAYAMTVFTALGPDHFAGTAALRTADAAVWNNAVSYLPFFLIARLGFSLLRSIMGQSEALRAMLGRLAGEQARVAAAASAYRIGHDIPKALLREVRRGTMSADQLAPWAEQYRRDLATALGRSAGEASDGYRASYGHGAGLAEELLQLSRAFVPITRLDLDLSGLSGPLPPGAPVLTVVGAVRELLNNAAYHAYGYPVALTAAAAARRLVVEVRSGGPGPDPQRVTAAWERKRNSVHMVRAAGGDYHVGPADPSAAADARGLSVVLEWPNTEQHACSSYSVPAG